MFLRRLAMATTVLIPVCLCSVGTSKLLQAETLSSIREAMADFVDRSQIAGAVSLIATKDGIVHCDAVGMRDIHSKLPMENDTICWIASMSKPVTAAAIMLLVDEGKIRLDDPITKFLPEMSNLKLKDGTKVDITVQHLLTHTSGMSELPADQAYSSRTLAEASQKYAQVPILFAPGSQWKYSQTSINTAARIVEVVSGSTFDAFLRDRLFEPLGMNDTTFYLSDEQMRRLAKSYRRLDGGLLEEVPILLLNQKSPTSRDRFPAANGGLFSTAEDYSRFARMLLRDGEFEGKRILSQDSVRAMKTIATGDLVTGFTPGNGWGIGCCVVREPNGVTKNLSAGSFGHGGAYGTQAWIDPIRGVVSILMIQRSNLNNSDGSEIRQALHERTWTHLAQGSFSGEPESDHILLQTRLTKTVGFDEQLDIPGAHGFVRFEWSKQRDFSDARQSDWLETTADHDFIARTKATKLEPATTYFYRVHHGYQKNLTRTSSVCEFKTLPGKSSSTPVHFIMGSCMNYNKFLHGKAAKADGPLTATEEDKELGYPSFASIAKMDPDFFIGTGDIVYYDNIQNGPAQTLPELRQCWHEQFRFPRLVEFFDKTPAYWSKDDHDFRFNDSDNEGAKQPSPSTGIEIFREQMPILAMSDRESPSYRTHRLNKEVQLWFSEGRDYRSPNKMSDGPEKSLWGDQQRDWLKKSLLESDATWKILITPTPMVGPDDASKKDNHTNLGGFRHEADEFFSWLNVNGIKNFVTFCGDRHWQYHSRHPSGVEEFACGTLNDENSRMGVRPGSKRGTDPDKKIVQFYTYDKPTGGFVSVQASRELQVTFFDDQGTEMYSVTKKPNE